MVSISIIVPVYNSEQYIARCLESIINQRNLPNIEILIVDDGSTDDTPKILEKYRQKYKFIRVITQENQKQSSARNNGLQNASGEYVMFIDSDDYLEKNMLSLMYNKIMNEQTDLCICGIRKIFTNRTEVETISCLQNSKDILADYLCMHQEMDVGLWNKIFKRSIIEKNMIFFENGNFFEDTLFVFKYLCNIEHGVSFVEMPLYNLVKRDESTTTSYSPEIEAYARKLMHKTTQYLEDLGRKNQYINQLNIMNTRSLIHIIHHNIKFNKKNNMLERINGILNDIQYKFIFNLPFKYAVGLLILKISPTLYIWLYSSVKKI